MNRIHSSLGRLVCYALLPLVSSVAALADDKSPEVEQRSFQLADGLAVNLFASESLGIANPIQMRWDPRGRLWVICSTVYPQIDPGQQADDKVFILEDTDGDGRADKSTVFADGLFVPTGFELGDGGVYLGQGSELLHLKDTDADDRADQRRVLFSGFGTGDSHQNINSFIWSPGGELFFCQGYNSYSRVETPWGIRWLDQGGVWRFRPHRMQLDPFFGRRIKPNNPWGIAFDDWNQGFVVAGEGNGIYYLTPALVRNEQFLLYHQIWDQKRKLCGMEIVGTRHLPDWLQGKMVLGGYFHNRVDVMEISESGAGFRIREVSPLVESTDVSFRPIDVKVGPDGALYVCDWYNPIIGHYQASFRHPERDKNHGRIWRLVATDRRLIEKTPLLNRPPGELLDQLTSPERWVRYQSKRILAELPTAQVETAVRRWIAELDPDSPSYNRCRLDALGVFESHELVEPQLLAKLLHSDDYRVRAYATRVVGRWHDRLDDPLALLAERVIDLHPRVRLEAIVAASHVPAVRSVEVAVKALDHPIDQFTDFALRQAVFSLRPYWRDQFQSAQLPFGGNVDHLVFALQVAGTADVLQPLLPLLSSGKLDTEDREAVLRAIARIGDPRQLSIVFDRQTYTSDGRHDARMHARLLDELATAFRLRKVQPSGDLAKPLRNLCQDSSEPLRIAAIRLIGVWKITTLEPVLVNILGVDGSAKLRRAVLQSLAQLATPGARQMLTGLATFRGDYDDRAAALLALSLIDTPAAAQAAVSLMSGNISQQYLHDIVWGMLDRKGGADALADALDQADVSSDVAKLALREVSAAGRQDGRLVSALNRHAGITGQAPRYDPALVEQLVREVRTHGDAARGQQAFRSELANCIACHTLGGAGGQMAPELGAIGSGIPLNLLIESVLWPNRQVKEEYLARRVLTADGEVLHGYLVREDQHVVVYKDAATGQLRPIAKEDIEVSQQVGSIMPQNLTNGLTGTELRDLLRFLSELGRPGPYRVSREPVVRRWQVLNGEKIPDVTAGNISGKLPWGDLPPESWQVRYSLVSGGLPVEDLTGGSGSSMAVARAHVRVVEPGKFHLRFNSTAGLRLWVDQTEVPIVEPIEIELPAGQHAVSVMVAIDERGAVPLRCTCAEVPGSSGRLQIKGG